MRVGKGMRKGFGKALRQLQNQQGMALAIVLMVIVVFSILGVGLLTGAETNIKLATVDRSHQSAYYIAEAGATYKLKEMNDQINSTYTTATSASAFFNTIGTYLTASNYVDFSPQNGVQPTATANVQDVTPSGSAATTKQYKITSVGKIGTETATVTQTFSVNYTPTAPQGLALPDLALFGTTDNNSTIKLDRGAVINGSIGTNATITPSIFLTGNPTITGDIFVNPDADLSKVVQADSYLSYPSPKKLEGTYSFPDPISNFPSIPSPTSQYPNQLTNNNFAVVQKGNVNITDWTSNNYTLDLTKYDTSTIYSFDTFTIKYNNNLKINVGDQNRTIIINNLNVSNGHILLTGQGKLTIYILNQLTMGSGSTINDAGNINQLNVYYAGTDPLSFAGDQKVAGSLYAKTANITISRGGGFIGPIITGGTSFTVTGDGSGYTQLFYAPNAAFSMSGAGTVIGKIVCKSFTATGGSELDYKAISDGSIPFNFTNNSSGSSSQSTPPADLFSPGPIHQSN